MLTLRGSKSLPVLPSSLGSRQKERSRAQTSRWTALAVLVLIWATSWALRSEETLHGLEQCRRLETRPLSDLEHPRQVSDRYVTGTPDILIHNATIWTGAANGTETFYGASIWLSHGLVKELNPSVVPEDVERHDAGGAWVTPGIVDMHSHAGQVTFPGFAATTSLGSRGGIIMPYSRSIDSFDTSVHDMALRLVTSGGTTTSLILPGSGSAMGGEAFAMKFRNTSSNSPTSMLVEPPFAVDGDGRYQRTRAWRNAKHATGENVSKQWKELGGTRQDNIYYMRKAYAAAARKRDAQDGWCAVAVRKRTWAIPSSWPFPRHTPLGEFPESTLEEELLVDVLRGNVKIHVHAYESTDFDALMRLSNEFQFPIATLQHAHEAWFSIDTLKAFHGGTPAVAMFSTSSIYKHEAYRHSLFAPVILAEQDIPVIFKSDHPPAVDSRYLLAEATLGHYFGLAENLALMSVTSTPARAIGLDHRIGYLSPGYDADLVIWQSHPLSLGATPAQVFVDGIPQLESPALVPRHDQLVPPVGNFSQQITAAKHSHHGDVDLDPIWRAPDVTFTNVSSYIYREQGRLHEDVFDNGTVVVEQGRVTCTGICPHKGKSVNLLGGSLSPGLTLFGTSLGLIEVNEEPSTTDQDLSPASAQPPPGPVKLAANAAVFGGKEGMISLRAGITTAVSPPMSANIFKGYSMFISVGGTNRLHTGAMREKLVAYHVSVGHAPAYPPNQNAPQISAQIEAISSLLLNDEVVSPLEQTFRKIALGQLPLVVFVSSADQMATLLELKREVEQKNGSTMRMVFDNALEAHVIAKEIAAAGVGVITRERGNPVTWDDRRALPGVPLSEDTNISALRRAGVVVGIGMTGSRASTSVLRFHLAYSLTDTTRHATKLDALALATTNLETLLDLPPPLDTWVATECGGLLDIGNSRIVAVGMGDGTVAGF